MKLKNNLGKQSDVSNYIKYEKQLIIECKDGCSKKRDDKYSIKLQDDLKTKRDSERERFNKQRKEFEREQIQAMNRSIDRRPN